MIRIKINRFDYPVYPAALRSCPSCSFLTWLDLTLTGQGSGKGGWDFCNYLILTMFRFLLIGCCLLLLASCQTNSYLLEPTICYAPPVKLVERLPSDFECLSPEEKKQDWGKEMVIAEGFAREMDLYRAITGYKRAEFLIPRDQIERRLQIEYSIFLCYYLGGKHQEAIEIFEDSDLTKLNCSFPAFSNILIILYDCYQKTCNEERAELIFELIEKYCPEAANELRLSDALLEGDVCAVDEMTCDEPKLMYVQDFLDNYYSQAKSVKKAQTLNALLPGAGYYYVGQKKAAVTSFIINALFTAAAYQFFHKGYIAAGVITTSLEMGWYMGGINGAGLAAKTYNECLYSEGARDVLIQGRLFPVLMFETTF